MDSAAAVRSGTFDESTRRRLHSKSTDSQTPHQHPKEQETMRHAGEREAGKMARHKRQDSGAPSSGDSAKVTPNRFHKPNTTRNEESVYVLTLGLTPSVSVPLDQMREEYFPKHLNRTSAHVTLFHALPHSKLSSIEADLKSVTSCTRPYHISTGRPFRIQKGVAVRLDSGAESSEHLREELRERWLDSLSEQDRRSWQPHWTVMNKVDEEKKVDKAFHTIRRVLFEDVHHGKAVGLTLWRYIAGGTWVLVREYAFQGHGKTRLKTSSKEGGAGYFDLKTKESRSANGGSKSPEALKAGIKVAGMWKSMTGKRGARQKQER